MACFRLTRVNILHVNTRSRLVCIHILTSHPHPNPSPPCIVVRGASPNCSINFEIGPVRESLLSTGKHEIADVHCVILDQFYPRTMASPRAPRDAPYSEPMRVGC